MIGPPSPQMAPSPVSDEADGAAKLAAEMPRQIANAHTVFNVVNTLIFIGFTGPIAALVSRLVPDRREPRSVTHLDEILLRTPTLALHMIRLELGRVGASVHEMVRASLETVISGSAAKLTALARLDNEVDLMHGAVLTYLGRLSQQNLGIDTTFYPLGSCSMKYNPRINETLAARPALLQAHPYQSTDEVQGRCSCSTRWASGSRRSPASRRCRCSPRPARTER